LSGASTGMGVYSYRPHGAAAPAQFRFTGFTRMAAGASTAYDLYLSGNKNYSTLDVRDCAFLGGGSVAGDASDITVIFENNLFERAVFIAEDSQAVTLHNNLFKGGSVGFDNWGDTVWVIKDNAFDNCSLSASWSTPYDHGHNAYVNASRIDASITNDIVLTNFNYVPGPLGNYYQLSTNLINAGSRTADLAALYHYTTVTNLIGGLEIKETNSVVDCGLHYVAVGSNNQPIDSDNDLVPDYLEDGNGNGAVNSGETDWNSASDFGLKVLITRPQSGSQIP